MLSLYDLLHPDLPLAGCQAITKVLSLFLAAIGVTFIRRGVMAAIREP